MDLRNQTLPCDSWKSQNHFRKELDEAVREAPDTEVEAVLRHEQGINLVLTYGPRAVEGRLTGLGDLGEKWDPTGERIESRRRPMGDRWIDDFAWKDWHTQASWLLRRLGANWLAVEMSARELAPLADPFGTVIAELDAALDRLEPGLHVRVGVGEHTLVITPSKRPAPGPNGAVAGYVRQGPMPPWHGAAPSRREQLMTNLRDWVEALAGPAGPEAVSVTVSDGPTDYTPTVPSSTPPFPGLQNKLKWDTDPFGTLAGRARPAVELPAGWTEVAEALLDRIVEAEDLSRPLPVAGQRQFTIDLGVETLTVEAIDVDAQFISNRTVWPYDSKKQYAKYQRPEIVGKVCAALAGAEIDPGHVLTALSSSPPRPVGGTGTGGSEVDDLIGRLQANLPRD